jgi:hypothetical protein
MYPQQIWQRASATDTASGDSGDLAVGAVSQLALDLTVSALDPAASVVFELRRKAADGLYYAVWTSDAVSSAGTVSRSVGAGLESAQSFGRTAKLVWTITGGTAGVTFSGGIDGK